VPRTTISSPLVFSTPWPFCAAVRAGDLTFLSGSVGADPRTGALPGGRSGYPDAAAQTKATAEMLDQALAALGSRREELARLLAYHATWSGYERAEGALSGHYGAAQPARSTVGHGLVSPGFLVELEGIAVSGVELEPITVAGVGMPEGVPAAVRAGNLIFLSGLAGVGEDGRVVATGDVRAQTRQALENARAVLAAAGATPRDVIRNHTTIVDWRDFDAYNEIYAAFFGQPYPARASIQGTLGDPDRLIEFEMTAVLDGGERTYVDTGRLGAYQDRDHYVVPRERIILDDRMTPGVAPHCAGVRSGDLIAVSGMVATDLEGKLVGPGDVRAQTHAVLTGIGYALEKLGSELDDVVKTQVSLVDWRHYAAYNEVYAQYFSEPYPARATVQGGLAQYGLLVEVEAYAVAGASSSATVLVGETG